MITLRRPRRNRKSAAIRALVRENHLLPSDLVSPIFVIEGFNQKIEISSMPGVFRLSIDLIIPYLFHLYNLGIRAIDLFAYVPGEKKDYLGSEAIRKDNLITQAISAIKEELPDLCVMVDIALDPYTDHGHDGIMDDKGRILNDPTLEVLAEMSLHAAQAGADIVAPSDMMDGRIGFIRRYLDQNGYTDVGILAYSAKYASSFYGPFREALHSAPRIGDKKTYQMDPANSREAFLECALDEVEGADMLMIKPALAYLDIIAGLRQRTELPIAAYQVSGEYSMIMAAALNGWLDADKIFFETLLSIKRAGADFIFTYAAERTAIFLANPE